LIPPSRFKPTGCPRGLGRFLAWQSSVLTLATSPSGRRQKITSRSKIRKKSRSRSKSRSKIPTSSFSCSALFSLNRHTNLTYLFHQLGDDGIGDTFATAGQANSLAVIFKQTHVDLFRQRRFRQLFEMEAGLRLKCRPIDAIGAAQI